MQVVAGVDLGGTAINYTLVNGQEQFLIEGLREYPARSNEGPEVCLRQIQDEQRKFALDIGHGETVVRLGEVVAGSGAPVVNFRGRLDLSS